MRSTAGRAGPTIVALALVACASSPTTTPPSNQAMTVTSTTPTAAAEIARKLERGDYGDFWNYAVHDDVVGAVWAEPDSLANLEAIVRDPDAALVARFLACEVLFEKEFTFLGSVDRGEVAAIYGAALTGNLTGRANSWGLLYEEDDAGPVGVRFLMIGQAAIPVLRGLLDDDRALLMYEGSEAATIGNAYRYRVKDFAAYYLGKIVRAPLAYHADPADRDRAIDALRERLDDAKP